jgi:anaerobic selenocysteine-containing dehydrogenase
MAEKIPGFCALCRSRCGSISVVEDGVLIAQEPYPEHPTGKALCVKGRAAPEIVANTQRLLHPLVRTAPKGAADAAWRRVSWDEALDRVAAEISRIRDVSGAEAVSFAITSPSGSPLSDGITWIERLVNAFGSPNLCRGTEICNWHKDVAHAFTFGRGISSPDFANTQCVVLWGHNPSATWLDHATGVTDAFARGAKIIVVDPRKAGFAMRAHQWLRVRPGADGALALSIAGEMIRNGWYDSAFIRDFSNGPLLVRRDTGNFLRERDLAGGESDRLIAIDESTQAPVCYDTANATYSPHSGPLTLFGTRTMHTLGGPVICTPAFQLYAELCAEYTPERAEELCWVPAQQVRDTAQLLFASRPVSYYTWSGVGQHTNATQTDRAIALLYSLTGSFDAAGGNVDFAHPPARKASGKELLPKAQLKKCVGIDDLPLGPAAQGCIGSDALYRAILEEKPYAIRGVIGFGANLVLSHANPLRAKEALQKLDFFVHADVTLTPTAQFADVVLPISTPWEREALRIGFEVSQAAEELVQLRPQIVAAAGESRSDAWVVFELAKRLGLGDQFWQGSLDEGMRYMLEPLGIGLEDLRKNPGGIRYPLTMQYQKHQGPGFRFATDTGKIEIYSELLLRHGYAPLPAYIAPLPRLRQHEAALSAYPLVLTSAKLPQYCHSQHRQIGSLRSKAPEPMVALHPSAAAARGIKPGAWVRVSTPSGSVRFKATLDPGLDPRVVCAQYGWWQANEALNLPAHAPLSMQGSNFNLLIDDQDLDPISGSAPHRSYVCDVSLDAPPDPPHR